MRISILGYYGVPNIGDEAILAVILRKLRDKFPGASIKVSARDQSYVRQLHSVDTYPLERNIAPPDIKSAPSADIDDYRAKEELKKTLAAPQAGRSAKEPTLKTFSEDELRGLVADVQVAPVPPHAEATDELRFAPDSDLPGPTEEEKAGESLADMVSASEAAGIVGGDGELEIIYATRGIYRTELGARVDRIEPVAREVWIVIVSPPGKPGEAVGAAVTFDGEVLFRTD